jgi:hypothetical protein
MRPSSARLRVVQPSEQQVVKTAGQGKKLALTFRLADLLTQGFMQRYWTGDSFTVAPAVNSRRGELVRAWVPNSAFDSDPRIGYTLGLHTRFSFRGNHGDQYVLHCRLGNEAFPTGIRRHSLIRVGEWIISELLQLIVNSPDIGKLLASQGVINTQELDSTDIAHWVEISAGPQARLLGRARPKNSVYVGDSIRNATASATAKGCITAFVKPRGQNETGPILGLSAAHVVTNFGNAPPGTTVRACWVNPEQNLGDYLVPHPFPFPANGRIDCDAALFSLDKTWKRNGKVRYANGNHRLVGAVTVVEEEMHTDSSQFGVVGQDNRVRSVLFARVNASQTFLDEDDNAYLYEGLIVLTPDPDAKRKRKLPLVQPGDSGGLVFRKSDIEVPEGQRSGSLSGLGLLVGGQVGRGGNSLAYCIRLDRVLNFLNVEVAQ